LETLNIGHLRQVTNGDAMDIKTIDFYLQILGFKFKEQVEILNCSFYKDVLSGKLLDRQKVALILE
jgi:hypothetical protein